MGAQQRLNGVALWKIHYTFCMQLQTLLPEAFKTKCLCLQIKGAHQLCKQTVNIDEERPGKLRYSFKNTAEKQLPLISLPIRIQYVSIKILGLR